MKHSNFVHLRVHTAYSLSEGAIKIKKLAELCRKMAMPAVAITDSNNLFGALEFSITCSESGIQPIIGTQLNIRREETAMNHLSLSRDGQKHLDPDHLIFLVQNERGYKNLLKLVSKAHLKANKDEIPQVSLMDLENYTEGLIVLTGSLTGAVGRLLCDGQKEKAKAYLLRLQSLFPQRLYIELQRHDHPNELRIEPDLLEFADELSLPLVATNEAYFIDQDIYEAHDALLCIANGRYLSEDNRPRVTPEHYFKSAEEMTSLFEDIPEAIENTLIIAQRCAFKVQKRNPILPVFQKEGQSEPDMLRQQTLTGLDNRLKESVYTEHMSEQERGVIAKRYHDRVNFELKVIIDMGFSGYFLIVAEFIHWAKTNQIPVGPGRGSGAGSVVAWSLTITDLDPLRWGLLFERFLNPDRISMPDFDIDLCQERRDEVIRHVQERYGYDQVAQIITFGKFQARMILRDVGRVLQMPQNQVNRICQLIPNNPASPVTLQEAIEKEPLLQEMAETDEQVKHLIDIAKKLEGLNRHTSVHAAGVVIGDRPLEELVPLYSDQKSNMPVTQFHMKWAEEAGLVKFDFLGLKTLTVLQKAILLIKENRHLEINLSTIPLDDIKTYEMLSRGDTVGVFQLESSGMRDVLRKMRADRIDDIIAVVALYRPGPMDNIPRYIDVKHGIVQPDYLHPRLEKILKDTFGIAIYQEQVMQIAQELSGYSLGAADILRRAMGKKIQSEMDQQRKVFVDGAVERGVDPQKANDIFDQVDKFAGYGFNKSHAAAYALVAYQTAWLKANYPVEFFAASMTYDMQNTDKLNIFRQELDRLKIPLLPPDINYSSVDFQVERIETDCYGVRYALAAIKNVGRGAMEGLVLERINQGPFKDIFDLSKRLDGRAINKRQIESLIKAGAFSSIEMNRAKLYNVIDIILKESSSAAQEKTSGQATMFDHSDIAPQFQLPDIPDWPIIDRLTYEFDAIGFYLSAHPMDSYSVSLKRMSVLTSAEIAKHLDSGGHSRIKLAGTLNKIQERVSKTGKKYAFISVSDSSGTFDVMIYSDNLASSRPLLEINKPLLLTVEAKKEDDSIKMNSLKIEDLDLAASKIGAGLNIVIGNEGTLPSLLSLVKNEKKGQGRIALLVRYNGIEIETSLPEGYALTPQFRNSVRNIPGIEEVLEI